MGGLHAAIDAVADIRTRRALDPQAIASVDVELSATVYNHGWWPPERPLTPTGAQMNIGYVLAASILDGAALVAQFSPARIDADDIWELIPRISAHHNPDFDNDPNDRGKTVLKIRFGDGQTLESCRQAAGSILTPLTNDEVTAKYRELTRGVIGSGRRRELERLVLSIETLPHLQALERLLSERVSSPL
jgi:2-methylcitrate dehydratase PrpD